MSSDFEAQLDELERAGIKIDPPLWLKYQRSIKDKQQELADTGDEEERKALKKEIATLTKLLLDIYHTKVGDIHEHLLFEIGEDSTYWLYNKETGIYDELHTTTVRGIILNMAMQDGITATIAFARECMARYRAAYSTRGHKYTDFDSNFDMFHAKNGWIDLKTFKLLPHTPDILSRFVSPTTYDPKATCPNYDNTLDNVLPIKKDAVRVLDQFSGYILTGDIHLGKMLIIQSKPGFGKSTIVEAWMHVLGTNQLGIRKSLSRLTSDSERFAGANMMGKTLCWFDESETKSSEFGTDLERLVTGDYLPHIERKGINGIHEARNHIKCVLTANKLPSHKEDGIFRRMIYIKFPDNVPSLTDSMKADPNMINKMRDEASGILNRMIRGLQDLRKMRNFTMIEGEAELIEEMRIASDSVAEFLCTYFDPCEDGKPITTQALFDAYSYSDFFAGTQRYIKTVRSFAFQLRERAPIDYQMTMSNTVIGNQRAWTGLRIKDGYELRTEFDKARIIRLPNNII